MSAECIRKEDRLQLCVEAWRAAGPRCRCYAFAAFTLFFIVAFAGCRERDPEIRRYREIAALPAPVTEEVPAAAPSGPAAPAPPLAWVAPEEWEERPGGTMRIATFLTADGRECTLTAFPGEVGGLEANARRWLGQLRMASPSDDDLAGFLAGAEILAAEDGLEGRLLDFRRLAVGGGEAMLAGVFKKDGFTVFVKLAAPADILEAEEDRFRAFCRSLK